MYMLHMCTGQDVSVHGLLKGGVTASDSWEFFFFFFFFAFCSRLPLGPTERLNSG